MDSRDPASDGHRYTIVGIATYIVILVAIGDTHRPASSAGGGTHTCYLGTDGQSASEGTGRVARGGIKNPPVFLALLFLVKPGRRGGPESPRGVGGSRASHVPLERLCIPVGGEENLSCGRLGCCTDGVAGRRLQATGIWTG